MATKAPEYVDKYRQIDELLELMRGSGPADPVGQTTDIQDVIEKDPARGFDGPAHRETVDVRRAYRENLQLVSAADPRNLGRSIDTGRTVPKVFESPGDNLPSHRQSSGGVRARKPRGPQRSRQTANKAQIGVPGYIAHGMPGSNMETATKALEELRKQALEPRTRSTTDPDTAPSPSTGTSAEQRYFDATDVQVVSDQMPEMTNPNFEYVPGETGFDEWLAQHASGAEVRTGEGKDVSDTAYGVTVTQYVPKKTT